MSQHYVFRQNPQSSLTRRQKMAAKRLAAQLDGQLFMPFCKYYLCPVCEKNRKQKGIRQRVWSEYQFKTSLDGSLKWMACPAGHVFRPEKRQKVTKLEAPRD